MDHVQISMVMQICGIDLKVANNLLGEAHGRWIWGVNKAPIDDIRDV